MLVFLCLLHTQRTMGDKTKGHATIEGTLAMRNRTAKLREVGTRETDLAWCVRDPEAIDLPIRLPDDHQKALPPTLLLHKTRDSEMAHLRDSHYLEPRITQIIKNRVHLKTGERVETLLPLNRGRRLCVGWIIAIPPVETLQIALIAQVGPQITKGILETVHHRTWRVEEGKEL